MYLYVYAYGCGGKRRIRPRRTRPRRTRPRRIRPHFCNPRRIRPQILAGGGEFVPGQFF